MNEIVFPWPYDSQNTCIIAVSCARRKIHIYAFHISEMVLLHWMEIFVVKIAHITFSIRAIISYVFLKFKWWLDCVHTIQKHGTDRLCHNVFVALWQLVDARKETLKQFNGLHYDDVSCLVRHSTAAISYNPAAASDFDFLWILVYCCLCVCL